MRCREMLESLRADDLQPQEVSHVERPAPLATVVALGNRATSLGQRHALAQAGVGP